MKPESWPRLKELFVEAHLLPREQRQAFLDKRCGDDARLRRDLQALLDADQEAPTTFLETAAAASLAGKRIGPYRVLRCLGSGGMGVVYLAERADDAYRKRLAIKVLQPGEASEEIVRRFYTERQILAALDHPNIARLIDGGATEDGLPYFALEYVEGKPIDAYCKDRRLRVRERLELFVTLCDVVQFAHANLIVHRDLKPSNVLVTGDGVLKLLDFGIAKLLNPELGSQPGVTISLLRRLTPDYASPEQFQGGPITTASDVYSLGVLLYELLAGHRPYDVADRSPAEIIDAICRQIPAPPSVAVMRPDEADLPGAGSVRAEREGVSRRAGDLARLRRSLAGDLDGIVGKALRKTPERRYPSVALLADDIRRHLQGLPVRARRGTFAYRAGKFVRRYRWPLAAAVAMLVALLAFGTRLAWEKSRAEAALAVAEVERKRAEQTTALLVELFERSDPLRPGELQAREILERGAARVEGDFPDPAVRAGMQRTIGVAFRNLGLPERAIPLLESSLAFQRASAGGDRLAELETLHELAVAFYEAGDLDAAETHYQESLAGFRATLGDRHPDTGRALNDLAALRFQQGRAQEAEALFEQALAIRRGLGDAHPDLAETLNNLATLRSRSDPEGAVALYREALAIRRRYFGPKHVLVANTQQNLARLLRRQGRATEALPLATEALAVMREHLLTGDWRISVVETVVGGCLTDLGRHAEAEPLLLGAYENLSRSTGPSAGATRRALEQLVALYQSWGRSERAAEYRALLEGAGP